MRAKVLVLALGIVLVGGVLAQSRVFPDVKPGQWFYPYVIQIKDWGIVDGNDDGTFAPGRNINRAEFSKMIVRYDKRVDEKISKALEVVSDSKVDSSSSSYLPTIMYLDRDDNQVPNDCPSGWEMLHYGRIYENGDNMNRRICMTDKSCRVLYIRDRDTVTPRNCPDGWTEADFGDTNRKEKQRVCFVCLDD